MKSDNNILAKGRRKINGILIEYRFGKIWMNIFSVN